MGKTFAQSFLNAGIISGDQLTIFEKNEQRAAELNGQQIGTAHCEPGAYIQDADIIILAVKPQDAGALYPVLTPYQRPEQIMLSIMAGIKIADIRKHTGAAKIVRAMPNLPCQVGQGATAFKVSKEISPEESAFIRSLLATTGLAIEIDDENKIDGVTAISGSGPAYVFYFMEAMIQAGVQLGFSREDATQLTVQTFAGSIELFKANSISCNEWIQRVASKGGTTEAALEIFNQFDVKNHIGKGVLRAETRSKELSAS